MAAVVQEFVAAAAPGYPDIILAMNVFHSSLDVELIKFQ